jgi:hypothetical protein
MFHLKSAMNLCVTGGMEAFCVQQGVVIKCKFHPKNVIVCHDFGRSWSLSFFGRCSAVDVTGFLDTTDLCFIFVLFCLGSNTPGFYSINYVPYLTL